MKCEDAYSCREKYLHLVGETFADGPNIYELEFITVTPEGGTHLHWVEASSEFYREQIKGEDCRIRFVFKSKLSPNLRVFAEEQEIGTRFIQV